jgi:hypothetical protein
VPGPLDDTLKHLTELSPQDWVLQGGWPAAAASLIDADIATIARVQQAATWQELLGSNGSARRQRRKSP